MKYKAIKLIPTHFTLDVLVTDSRDNAIKFQEDYYGLKKCELEQEKKHLDTVATIDSSSDSIIKSETRICLILSSFDIAVIVHELVHVVWHTSNCSGINMNYQSQEWIALFTEYLFNEIMKKETYKTLNYAE